MLQEYERNGYLEVKPADMEAYITMPALMALSPSAPDGRPMQDADFRQLESDMRDAVRRIRAYGVWRSQKGSGALSWPFAVHVVKPDMPHDLLHTILITRRRVWWKLWMYADRFDVIDYTDGGRLPYGRL